MKKSRLIEIVGVAMIFIAAFSCKKVESNHCAIIGGCNQDSVEISIQDIEGIKNKFGVYFFSKRSLDRDEYIRELNHQFRDIEFFDAGGEVGSITETIDDAINQSNFDHQKFIQSKDGYRVINVYCYNSSNQGLLGFVSMPTTQFEIIKTNTIYWKVFTTEDDRPVATVVHEIGHLMSLPHRFKDECNIMSYGQCGYELNQEQRHQAVKFAEKWR